MARKKKISTDGGEGLAHNPFAGLGAVLADVPDGPAMAESAAVPPDEVRPGDDPAVTPMGHKLVVRRQKKGQGGKTITVIEGLTVNPAALDDLARRAAKALGCAARREGDRLVVAGGQHERVASWLREQGAPRVILGN